MKRMSEEPEEMILEMTLLQLGFDPGSEVSTILFSSLPMSWAFPIKPPSAENAVVKYTNLGQVYSHRPVGVLVLSRGSVMLS